MTSYFVYSIYSSGVNSFGFSSGISFSSMNIVTINKVYKLFIVK